MEKIGQKEMEILRQRVLSAAVLVPVCLLLTMIGPKSFFLLSMVVVVLGLKEWFYMPPVTGQNRKVLLLLGSGVIFFPMLLAIFADFSAAFPSFAFLVITFFLFVKFFGQGKNTAFYTAGLVYLGLPLCLLVWLRGIDTVGIWMILYIFAVTWGSDSVAYFIGKKYGRRKLAPSISPGKTVEGLAGAALGAMLFGMLIILIVQYGLPSTAKRVDLGHVTFLDWSIFIMIPLSALLGCIGQAGDLLESKIKRIYRKKDSGSLIPGHGGVLDRIDALVAVASFMGLLQFFIITFF